MSKIKRRKTKATHVVNIENVYIINFDGSKSEEKGKNKFKIIYGVLAFISTIIIFIGNYETFVAGIRRLISIVGL